MAVNTLLLKHDFKEFSDFVKPRSQDWNSLTMYDLWIIMFGSFIMKDLISIWSNAKTYWVITPIPSRLYLPHWSLSAYDPR